MNKDSSDYVISKSESNYFFFLAMYNIQLRTYRHSINNSLDHNLENKNYN